MGQRGAMQYDAENRQKQFTSGSTTAIAVSFRDGARGLGHPGIVSLHKDGRALFSRFGPQNPGRPIDKGKVESFILPNVQFDSDGTPSSESYHRMLIRLAEKTGYSADMIQFAYFKTSESVTAALDAWIEATQKASNEGSISGYRVLSSSCRDYGLTGLAKGGALGNPGYFYFSAIPNEMLLHLMRIADESYGSQDRRKEPKVKSKICFDGDPCEAGTK